MMDEKRSTQAAQEKVSEPQKKRRGRPRKTVIQEKPVEIKRKPKKIIYCDASEMDSLWRKA